MERSNQNPAYAVGLGGVLAALAVVTMCLGTLIPVATFICPMACILMAQVVRKTCGSRYGWAWYGAVAILSLLLAPDKEAAAVFAALGYYPILKPRLDRKKRPWLWKGLLFNAAILVMYWLLIHLLGLAALAEEFSRAGVVMTGIMLVLGNVIFFLLDRLLGRGFHQKRKKR